MPDQEQIVQPPTRLPPTAIMNSWRPGSADWDWPAEIADLLDRSGPKLAALVTDIAADGVKEPVLLGDDARVWDGHHRIICAHLARVADIPVEYGTGGT